MVSSTKKVASKPVNLHVIEQTISDAIPSPNWYWGGNSTSMVDWGDIVVSAEKVNM